MINGQSFLETGIGDPEISLKVAASSS